MNSNQQVIYEQVLRGLAEEWAHLEKLERGFGQELATLREIDGMARGPATPSPANAESWGRVERLFGEIHAHTIAVRAALETPPAPGTPDAPLAEWSVLLKLEEDLARLLAQLKVSAHAPVLPEQSLASAAAWAELESHFDILRAHSRAVQVKLEMRKRFGDAEASAITRQIMARLPEDLRSNEGVAAYQEAVTELQEEKQKFKGFFDVMKSLLLYVESPEERAQKKRIS
jgi:hypothetical protein